jgi:hypothetical protein
VISGRRGNSEDGDVYQAATSSIFGARSPYLLLLIFLLLLLLIALLGHLCNFFTICPVRYHDG